MNNITGGQSNSSVYAYLIQVQSLFSQYIQMKMQLDMLNNNLERANMAFDTLPTQQTLFSVQNVWPQKLSLMQQLQQKVNEIIITLVEATKLSLIAMQRAISNGDRIGIAVNESAIASICSLVEQGLGCTFLPDYATDDAVARGTIKRMTAEGFHPELWKQILYHREKWVSPSMQTVLDIMTEHWL